jgi:hypothetical protein
MLYNIKWNYNHCNNQGENVLMLTYSDARYLSKSPNPARYIILLDFWLLPVYGGKNIYPE